MSYSYAYSSSYGEDYNNNDNFENQEEVSEEYNFKDYILFAIDCSPPMLKANGDDEVPLSVAFKSVKSTLLNKVDGRPGDKVGVVLYGTNESNNVAKKDHIYIMQTLDTPDAPRIKQIDSLIDDLSTFEKQYGSSDQTFSIGDLFWVCSDIMSNAPKFATKRIFLITDNDDPTGGNPLFRKTSVQRAKDLSNGGVEITLFGLDKPDGSFDTTLFYNDIASFEESDDNLGSVSNTGKLTELLEKVKTLQTKNRSEFRVPFQIAPKLTIGIRGYNMVIEQKLSPPRNFSSNAELLQEVKSTTRWQCVDTNQYLTPIDIKLAYDYGGNKVVFTKDELVQIQTIRDPSILVLGFKQKKTLKAHHQVSHPYFIYPDESQYENSNGVFFSLLEVLLKRDRIAICSFIRRKNTMPKVVALIPQAEKLDENGNQIDPPGFQLIILPYADEIRPVPPTVDSVMVDDQCREAAKIFIDKLKIEQGYNPKDYPNPYLRNHKNMIQKIALESQNELEKPVDNSVPNYQFIESELSDDIESFKKLVGLDNISIEDLNDYTPKRKNASADDNSAAGKRARLENSSIEELWKSGNLSKATNQLLKDYLTTVGIQPKKLKADLISQIDDYLKVKQE